MASKFGFSQVATSQQQKETAINGNSEAIEKVFSALVTIDCSAGGTITPSAATIHGGLTLRLTGNPAAGFNLVVPSTSRPYLIDNNTSPLRSATVKTAAGAGVAVSTTTPKLLYCDGTDVLATTV